MHYKQYNCEEVTTSRINGLIETCHLTGCTHLESVRSHRARQNGIFILRDETTTFCRDYQMRKVGNINEFNEYNVVY